MELVTFTKRTSFILYFKLVTYAIHWKCYNSLYQVYKLLLQHTFWWLTLHSVKYSKGKDSSPPCCSKVVDRMFHVQLEWNGTVFTLYWT